MAQVVRAVEAVVSLRAYREEVLAHSPAIARHDPGGIKGVFFGDDFHVIENNFGLIEINTNAGGAMLNAVLSRAQQSLNGAPGTDPSSWIVQTPTRHLMRSGQSSHERPRKGQHR